MTKLRRIAAHYVYAPQGFLKMGMITIDEEGTVIEVSEPENPDKTPGVEFYNGIIIPGMVNAHTHLELSYLKGSIPPGGGFAAFAKGIREHRNKATRQERIKAAEYHDARMWADGVAAVADICNGEETFGIKKNSKIYYHSFIEMFGLGVESAGNAISILEAAKRCGIAATITPHSTYSLNTKGFKEAVGGDGNNPLSIHFMESGGEKELFDEKGELWKWYMDSGAEIDFTGRYESPADRITCEIPGTRNILLVHNTCAGSDDIIKIKEKFEDHATWVVCPASNKYITGGEPPVELLRMPGVNVAIGTDSLASNNRLSLIDEMKMAAGVPLGELIEWATINGARALGIDDRFGSFEKGKRPGIVQLTGADMDNMTLTPQAQTKRLA